MSSKTVKDQTEPEGSSGKWQPAPEFAPSVEQADELSLGRLVGMLALAALLLGAFALFLLKIGTVSRLNPYAAGVLVVAGLAGLLFHASQDADMQIRRMYLGLAYLWLLAGLAVTLLPVGGDIGSRFLTWGFLCLSMALFFLLPSLRHETESGWRTPALIVLGGGGGLLALTGFSLGSYSADYLQPYGILLVLLGLGFGWGFIAHAGTSSDLGHKAGLGMGLIGVVFFLIALGRSAVPPLLYSLGWSSSRPMDAYFASSGFLLMVLGLLYSGVSIGLVSDNRLAVLIRRELAAFFFSPMAPIVLFVSAVLAYVSAAIFVQDVIMRQVKGYSPHLEPIIFAFIWRMFLPVLVGILVVPILTMRLFSEEKRSGTLEVMLTAPVEDTTIVLSKFLSAWICFMVVWIPWGLVLVGLRVLGGESFDYRPAISFAIALACSGAAFMAMGLFFSCLTRNQVAAAILALLGVLVLLGLYIFALFLPEGSYWQTVLTSTNALSLWYNALTGNLAVRELVLQVSAAIFWLFLTVKVLEARKWS